MNHSFIVHICAERFSAVGTWGAVVASWLGCWPHDSMVVGSWLGCWPHDSRVVASWLGCWPHDSRVVASWLGCLPHDSRVVASWLGCWPHDSMVVGYVHYSWCWLLEVIQIHSPQFASVNSGANEYQHC